MFLHSNLLYLTNTDKFRSSVPLSEDEINSVTCNLSEDQKQLGNILALKILRGIPRSLLLREENIIIFYHNFKDRFVITIDKSDLICKLLRILLQEFPALSQDEFSMLRGEYSKIPVFPMNPFDFKVSDCPKYATVFIGNCYFEYNCEKKCFQLIIRHDEEGKKIERFSVKSIQDIERLQELEIIPESLMFICRNLNDTSNFESGLSSIRQKELYATYPVSRFKKTVPIKDLIVKFPKISFDHHNLKIQKLLAGSLSVVRHDSNLYYLIQEKSITLSYNLDNLHERHENIITSNQFKIIYGDGERSPLCPVGNLEDYIDFCLLQRKEKEVVGFVWFINNNLYFREVVSENQFRTTLIEKWENIPKNCWLLCRDIQPKNVLNYQFILAHDLMIRSRHLYNTKKYVLLHPFLQKITQETSFLQTKPISETELNNYLVHVQSKNIHMLAFQILEGSKRSLLMNVDNTLIFYLNLQTPIYLEIDTSNTIMLKLVTILLQRFPSLSSDEFKKGLKIDK